MYIYIKEHNKKLYTVHSCSEIYTIELLFRNAQRFKLTYFTRGDSIIE